jgi:hypothetical protein
MNFPIVFSRIKPNKTAMTSVQSLKSGTRKAILYSEMFA